MPQTPKKNTESDEITLAEAARRLGMTQQGLGQWASRADAPARKEGRNVFLRWPAFARWREQEMISAAQPADIDALRSRKLLAESELAELTLAERRGEVAPVAEMQEQVERICIAVRDEVRGLRSRFVGRIIGVTSEAEAAPILDAMGAQILAALRERFADGDPDAEDAA